MQSGPLLRYKAKIFLAYMAVYGVFYIFPNLHPLSTPNYLPMYALDRMIPLIPWTFLVYISDYLIFVVVILLHPTAASFRSFSRQAFLVLFICGTFFLLYPTTYPRPEYPETSSGLLRFVMQAIRLADTPNNCFPSMHVALTGIATWSMRLVKPKIFPALLSWTSAIFISTLTTKQHYIWDVVGGVCVTISVILIHWAVFERASLVPNSEVIQEQ